jgi:anti-sigma B factor antagonist
VTTWFEMRTRRDGTGRAWLIVDGELDIASVPSLRARLRQLIEQDGDVVLDLTAVTFLDSAAVALLWSLRDGRSDRKLALIAPLGQAREVLELTGLVPRPTVAG